MREQLIHKLDVIAIYLKDNNRAQAMRVVREMQTMLGATSQWPESIETQLPGAVPAGEDLGDVSDHLVRESLS